MVSMISLPYFRHSYIFHFDLLRRLALTVLALFYFLWMARLLTSRSLSRILLAVVGLPPALFFAPYLAIFSWRASAHLLVFTFLRAFHPLSLAISSCTSSLRLYYERMIWVVSCSLELYFFGVAVILLVRICDT